jgi:hypothetical protein
MGVTAQIFYFLNTWFNKDVHTSVCELGDQRFMCCFPFSEYSHTRSYFENFGVEYDSIDLNGQGGALVLNLNDDIEIKKQYDVVTNFGTLEHINDFYMGFKNMHKLCKYGGLMIHIIPALNHWPGHGSWRGDMPFYIKIGKTQKYTIKDLHIEPTYISPGNPCDQVHIVYEKSEENEFMTREVFNSFNPVQIAEPEFYDDWLKSDGREPNKNNVVNNE